MRKPRLLRRARSGTGWVADYAGPPPGGAGGGVAGERPDPGGVRAERRRHLFFVCRVGPGGASAAGGGVPIKTTRVPVRFVEAKLPPPIPAAAGSSGLEGCSAFFSLTGLVMTGFIGF